jgi:chromosome segregation protein
MRLVKLTLHGFKSFADRTEFTFDAPITGIVGPNGCGKSNVVDAVKWVLGERSSKSLRGTEMIDVIFAGSAGRKPLGMASVTLTFENPVLEGRTTSLGQRAQGEGHAPGQNGTVGAGQDGAIGTATGVASAEPASDGLEVPVIAAEDMQADASEAGQLLGDSGPIQQHVRGRRALPIDTDLVEVERRLYRDGGSEYLINGKKARLKDIRDLFMDTGVGADSYCIIEQGKVDAMLLANPQERRTIFEEAAGIAKYRHRKVEAERKLDRTNTNLAVTREQLESTERRLRIVKGQAAKARTFKQLDEELKSLRSALAMHQYHDLRVRLEGLTHQLTQLEEARSQAQAQLAALEAAKQEAELRRHDLAGSLRQAETEHQSVVHAARSAEQRGRMAEAAAENARQQMDEVSVRGGEAERQVMELAGAIATCNDQIAALSEQLGEAERHLGEITQQRAGVQEKLATLRSELASKRSAAANIDRERAALHAAVEQDQRRAAAMSEQLARLGQRSAGNQSARETLAQQRAGVSQRLAEAREALGELERRQATLTERSSRVSADRRGLAERVGELERQQARLDARRATLQEMVQSRLGLGEAAKNVLARRDRGEGFAGVKGALSDAIEVDARHAPAVEAALGSSLRALLIGSIADLPAPGELTSLGGRVTFVPLSAPTRPGLVASVAGSDTRAEAPGAVVDGAFAPAAEGAAGQGIETSQAVGANPVNESSAANGTGQANGTAGAMGAEIPDSVVRVRDLVRTHPGAGEGVPGLLDRLLSRTFLVRDLDSAVLLAAGPLLGVPGVRFVTLDGSVMDEAGRVTAGPMTENEGSGVLARQSELRDLEAELAVASSELDSSRDALRAVDTHAAELADEIAVVAKGVELHRRTLATDEVKLEQLSREHDRLERERTALGEEMAALSERQLMLDAEQASLREKAEGLSRLYGEQVEAAKLVEAELAKVQAESDAAVEAITAAKVQAGRLAEQLSHQRRERQRLQFSADESERLVRSLQAQVQSHQNALDDHLRAVVEARAAFEQAHAQAGELAQRAQTLKAEADAAAQEALASGERVLVAREQALHVERDWHSVETGRRELEVRREHLEDRTLEEIALDLKLEYVAHRHMIDGGLFTQPPLDVHATTSRIDELRKQIKSLGNVNLDAIDEEGQLQGRNEELAAQVADLDQAATQLGQLIIQLNDASRGRFERTFNAIQEHFAGQDGMFRKLFGGGKAEVRLMPVVRDGVETQETDWLESGIEIIAKPPGKEPRSISQLSGGEKSMTAVALLMSIFRSKPSCFCVLDEVDAALDDANVDRFCKVVKQFTSFSNFIVITHHKRTMHEADQLFGVTMQERGVSKRVSVRIDQVGANGQIREEAGAKAAAAPAAPVVEQPSSPAPAAGQPPVETPAAPAPAAAPPAGPTRPGPLRRGLAALVESSRPVEPSEP